MNGILFALIVLGGIGMIAAVLLSVISRKFAVSEDERISRIETLLPGANCGGCGQTGCHAFAVACCEAESLSGLECPGAGKEAMRAIADILGVTGEMSVAKVAVLKCDGDCEARMRSAFYDGARSCAIMAAAGNAESLCAYGCLGGGDCVDVCAFDAIGIDSATGLAVVDDKKCTGCGACVKVCPRSIIELRPYGPRGMRVWVACSNRDKGAIAMKECKQACIGCAKCSRVCTHEAITVSDNLAYIDAYKCKLCRKCVDTCPTDAIRKINFPETKVFNSQQVAE
ncbi:MAG: RnfABCDGE type electron transport complex subunit B [Paramuribaculum sp.]|nr:RnfABCDGE type electron transport complex subunit B [Paramuribaculum sp.]